MATPCMRPRIAWVLASLLSAALAVGSAARAQTTPTLHMVAMRDSARLATDVYLPGSGTGPWPVALARTPYGRRGGGAGVFPAGQMDALLSAGIAVAVQDVRGRFDSEGEALAFVADGWGALQDGYDTVVWLRAQAWCDGSVATAGASAVGFTQVLLAGSAPPGVAGQVIALSWGSNYHALSYQGGVFRWSLVEGWLTYAQWPLDENLALVRAHPYYDSMWAGQNIAERVGRVDWPVTLMTGWYDITLQSALDHYAELRARGGPLARDGARLLIGPYAHTQFGQTTQGEIEFPASAAMPYGTLWPEDTDWLEHWLTGRALDPEPSRVVYYVMGETGNPAAPGNVWRTADDWPPAARETRFFLAPGGALRASSEPEAGQRQYTYDPANPVPTVGGQNLSLPAGPRDQRPVESRADVLLFDTEALTQPAEITGRMTAVLYVSTEAVDTDFTAKLTDVHPDGRSLLVADGIRRLSLREGYTAPQAVEAGEVYRLEIDLGSTSLIFNTGHRLRLAVSSSNSPRFEPNPNTGDPGGATTQPAQQTLHLGGQHASHILLPVIPGPAAVSSWGLY